MGSLESVAKQKRRRRNIRAAVLIAIGAAGYISISAMTPHLFRLLGRSGNPTRLKYQSKGVLSRLKQKGEIEFIERDGKKYARLTEHGEKALAFEQQKMMLGNAKPKKWDHHYRLVIFDVPEKRKGIRDRLRREMQEVGFLRIQDSAWLYPYDCEEFMALLKADLHIGKDVLYAIVEEIENDIWIRKHFNLSLE